MAVLLDLLALVSDPRRLTGAALSMASCVPLAQVARGKALKGVASDEDGEGELGLRRRTGGGGAAARVPLGVGAKAVRRGCAAAARRRQGGGCGVAGRASV